MVVADALSVADPYHWLEEGDSPETQRWIRAQQDLYDAQLATWPAHRWLSERISAWLHRDEWSVPRRRASREFATLLRAGIDHPQLLYRDHPHAEPQLLVDPMVDGGPHTTLDAWEPSPTGDLIAFQLSDRGVERGELMIRTVADGRVVDGPINGVRYSPIAWVDDSCFYYIREAQPDGPGAFRRRGVWFHRLGAPVASDELVFTPSQEWPTVIDVQFEHARWLIVTESFGTGNRNELWIADTQSCDLHAPGLTPIQCDVDVETRAHVGRDGWLYLLTTADAPRRQLCRTPADQPSAEHWTTLIAHDPDSNLSDFALIHDGDRVAEILTVRGRLGFAELTVHAATTGQRTGTIALPGAGRLQDLVADGDHRFAHLVYAGVNQPAAVYRYQHETHQLQRDGFDAPHETPPRLHRVENTYQTIDGTSIPIVVLSTHPLPATEPRPTILHAYGSFGEERQFGFSATVLSWLELGGQYAVAYVRGGGDLGRSWHHQGIRERKTNTIDDLLAAADWIVDQGHTTRDQLCLSGSSAGGLLMLAAITRQPDVAAGAIASAPLADMARFEQLGIGALWRAEFGTAADEADLATLLSYSPYHNVRSGEHYPAVLLTGFHGDTRAGAAHPRKMAAALQAANTGNRPILLRYETDLGHGRKPRSRAIALAAEVHAFAAATTGLQPPAPASDRPQPQKGGEPP